VLVRAGVDVPIPLASAVPVETQRGGVVPERRGWQRVPAGDHPSQPFVRDVLELTGVIPLPTATIDQTSVPDADRYPARTTSGPPAR
jgi:hypothetical protein